MIWKEISWNLRAGDWLEQLFHATETFNANGDEVFVWEHIGFFRHFIRHVLASSLEKGRTTWRTNSCSRKIPWIPQTESMVAAVAAKHSAPECASQCLRRKTYSRLPAVQVFIPPLQHNARQISLPPASNNQSRSGASRRESRAWDQVHCIFQNPKQRGVSCSSTAFRRSPFRLHDRRFNHWRLHHRRLHQWKLQHPLGEHRNPFSLFLDAFHLSSQKREHILI